MNVPRTEWFVASLGLAIGAVLLIGSRSIAPPLFDPVGSAAVPIACAIALIAMGLANLIDAVWKNKTDRYTQAIEGSGIRPATFGFVTITVGYIASMNFGLRFSYATVLFVVAAIPLIGARRNLVPVALVIALLLGFGSEWMFTKIFFVDLPGTR